jgi:hypothetical protein
MQALLRQFSPVKLVAAAIAAVLLFGYGAPLERYITPARGWGYTLGIIGGSMMLRLIYPARKRVAWLGFVGGVPGWFHVAMLSGTLGPLCILFQANFSLGTTNSNVALFCMLTVAGSGVIGRYLYTRIRARLDGGQTNPGELRRIADQLRVQSTSGHGRELCHAPARCQSSGRGVSAVRAAVFPVACTACAAVHHVVDRGQRAPDLVRDLLTTRTGRAACFMIFSGF